MPARTIAIGDIHGCSLAFEAVLNLIQPTLDDTIVTLGDYVDRGPDSRGVLDRILRLQDECHLVPLLGNHELMLLAAVKDTANSDFWLRCGGAETLASYEGELDTIPADHLQFLQNCYTYYETDTHIFVHANYEAGREMEAQSDMAMFWNHLSNYRPLPHRSGKVVVVGHTPQADGRVLDIGHLICVDTYCFGDGCLTALDVETSETWQADKLGQAWIESAN